MIKASVPEGEQGLIIINGPDLTKLAWTVIVLCALLPVIR